MYFLLGNMKKFTFLILLLLLAYNAFAADGDVGTSNYGSAGAGVDSLGELGGQVTPYANSTISATVSCSGGSISGTPTTISLTDATNFPSAGIADIRNNTGNRNVFLYTGKSGNNLTGVTNGTNGSNTTCTTDYTAALGGRVYALSTDTSLPARLNVLQDAVRNTQETVGVNVVSVSSLGVSTCEAAVAAIGASTTVLRLDSTITATACTTPSNITLECQGGMFDLNQTASALTIQGAINCEDQIFTDFAINSVVVQQRGITNRLKARWWGALGNDTGNQYTALQANLNACSTQGCEWEWSAGSYAVSQSPIFPSTINAPMTLWAYGARLNVVSSSSNFGLTIGGNGQTNTLYYPTTVYGLTIYQPTNATALYGITITNALFVNLIDVHIVAGGNASGYACFRAGQSDPSDAGTGALWVSIIRPLCIRGAVPLDVGFLFEGRSNAITVFGGEVSAAVDGVIIRDQSGGDGVIPNDITIQRVDFETVTTHLTITSSLATAGILGLRFIDNRLESAAATTVIKLTGITTQPLMSPFLSGNQLEFFGAVTYADNANALTVNACGDVQQGYAVPCVMPAIATLPGVAASLTATAPTAAASTTAGAAVSLTASAAVAGTTNAGAAAGGAITLTAGNAARLTSGNAAGGDIILVPGTGIGTGRAGEVLYGDGTTTVPAIAPSSDTDTGFTKVGDGIFGWIANGTLSHQWSSNQYKMYATNPIVTLNDNSWIRDGATGIMQQGLDVASPVAQTYKACDGTLVADKTGCDMTLAGGSGTGSGLGGALIFSTAPAGGAGGASLNALVERGRFFPAGQFRLSEIAADPSAADLTSGANAEDRIALYMKADKFVIAYNRSGTVTYLTIPLDGTTATWTQGTSAP